MISWYYWDFVNQKHQKNIVRSYSSEIESIRYRLPGRLQNPVFRPNSNEQADMRILYKDYVKNSPIISQQLKSTKLLNDFMAQQRFFNILQDQKAKLQKTIARNRKFVYKASASAGSQQFMLYLLNKRKRQFDSPQQQKPQYYQPFKQSSYVANSKKVALKKSIRIQQFSRSKQA